MGNPFYPGNNQPQGNQNGFGIPDLNNAPPEVRGSFLRWQIFSEENSDNNFDTPLAQGCI